MGNRGCEGLRRRWPISERRMWSDSVVVLASLLDDDLRFVQAVEDFSIQQFIAEIPVVRLAVAILPRAAGFDEQSSWLQPASASCARPLPSWRLSNISLVTSSPTCPESAWRSVVSSPAQKRKPMSTPAGTIPDAIRSKVPVLTVAARENTARSINPSICEPQREHQSAINLHVGGLKEGDKSGVRRPVRHVQLLRPLSV